MSNVCDVSPDTRVPAVEISGLVKDFGIGLRGAKVRARVLPEHARAGHGVAGSS